MNMRCLIDLSEKKLTNANLRKLHEAMVRAMAPMQITMSILLLMLIITMAKNSKIYLTFTKRATQNLHYII